MEDQEKNTSVLGVILGIIFFPIKLMWWVIKFFVGLCMDMSD